MLLQRLPVSEIKVDRSFVRRIALGGDGAIVRSIIDLAHALGIEAVAEGVETREAWQQPARRSAATARRAYVARPMPAPEATHWLIERVVRPSEPAGRWPVPAAVPAPGP